MKRLIDIKPAEQARTVWNWDASTEESRIVHEQDITALIAANRVERNATGKRMPGKDDFGVKVASIPMGVFSQMMKEGKTNDQAYLKRWLNDPDNRVFRTNEMTV